MDRFIKIACDEDYSQLFINEKDYVLTPEVIKVWDAIYEAFLDGMKDKKGLQQLRLIGKKNHLEFTYELIQLCIKFLRQGYHPDIIQILQKHIRVGNFNPDDMASYHRDMQVVLNRSNELQVKIEELKAELAILQGTDKPGEKATRKQFDQLISAVSIHVKFHIDKKSVTVGEFIEYYIARRESIEAMEDAYNKSKSGR